MAYPGQPQALYELSQILTGDRWAREGFECQLRAGQWGVGRQRHNRMYSGPWRTSPSGDMTCVDLSWSPFLLGSLRIAMLKEVIGIAPERYCVVGYRDDGFFRRLQLLLTCLPEGKIFLHDYLTATVGPVLGGPFLSQPWLSRGQAIQARPTITHGEFLESFVTPF